MKSLKNRPRQWKQRKNAEGFVLLLAHSSQPLEILELHASKIDDVVVSAILNQAQHVANTEGPKQALRWVGYADRASLLGGSAASLADCVGLLSV